MAISPSGRYVVASGVSTWHAVLDWASGEVVRQLPLGEVCKQYAFHNDDWVAYVHHSGLHCDSLNEQPTRSLNGVFSGAVAVSPDGKTLVASENGRENNVRLLRWSLPNFQAVSGFDYWSPFSKLAFSPDGEFLAGMSQRGFELRFAVTGGLDFRFARRGHNWRTGFVAFSPDSELCVFGWEEEFRVLDISTGTSRVVSRVDADYTDAAFTGSGQFFATADDRGVVKFWSPRTWEVVREYDWGCGTLTAMAFTADGSAGVCGTADGRLLQFDVDD